jgi:hypothetical protein
MQPLRVPPARVVENSTLGDMKLGPVLALVLVPLRCASSPGGGGSRRQRWPGLGLLRGGS